MTQEKALEILKAGHNVFLTGEPGAGKTYVVGKFAEWMAGEGIEYAVTASTGIAASHINGSTIHSWTGIGIKRGLEKRDLDWIAKNPYSRDRIRMVRTLVIDEVSMIDAVTLEDVDAVLRAVHGNAEPFGGIQVVLVGDFYQLPPVSRDGSARFCFEAQVWSDANLRVCYLTEQHRQSDGLFLEILAAMRRGDVTEAHKAALRGAGGGEDAKTKLFTHNEDVDELNDAELAKLKGKEHVFLMREEGVPALVKTIKRNCLSPERLALKVGAVVMFTRNNFEEGWVNGSLGRVAKFVGGRPVVELVSGLTARPDEAEWTFTEGRHVKAKVSQMPLRLAWAITVHKSQGMSLDAASVDLASAFEYGQGYVAISRVRTLAGLHLRGANDRAFEVSPIVAAADAKFRAESMTLEEKINEILK